MKEQVGRSRDPVRALAAEIVRENLKVFREAAGLTQQEAAFLAEESIDNIRRWESKGGIKSIEIAKLAKVYKRTVEEITEKKQDPKTVARVDPPDVAYTAIVGLSAKAMRDVIEFVKEAGGEFREIKLRKDVAEEPPPLPKKPKAKKPKKGRK